VCAIAARADTTIGELRGERRAAVRAAALRKLDGGAPFGLLVVPVDFADARFPASFDPRHDLAPRLGEATGALGHYVATAANGRTRLAIVLAPLVPLAGERLDYSDLGWQGFERSRAMAAQALAGAAARGVEFAAADQDGDGEIDGVLLLHADAGLENDPGGLIVPQQYFLAEPVVQRGTVGRSYAIAAARSTLGIWAHETGHLLGLEDRYDLDLASDGDTGPRGGLGAFSLMAAGWRGSGAGEDPALPDAYSRLALGWIDAAAEPAPDAAVRLAASGPRGPESFLAERRDPVRHAPYDAVLPGPRLLVYHLDEALAEGEASSPAWPDRHLRVQLVEADGGDAVARGEAVGVAADLFPSDGRTQAFDGGTTPSSRTWAGEPTGVAFTVAIDDAGELQFAEVPPPAWGDLRLRVGEAGGEIFVEAIVRLDERPAPPPVVPFTLEVLDAQWGQFAGGPVIAGVFDLPAPDGAWEDYAGVVATWVSAGSPPPGATTRFRYALDGGDRGAGEIVHVWDPAWADLTPGGDWLAAWTVVHPGGDASTTWHRWPDGGPFGLAATPILACTGAAFPSGAVWPEIAYTNGADARLVTPALGASVRWLELTHAVDLELLHPSVAIDGVELTWVHDGGYETPAVPADGWLGAVEPRANHAFAGRPTFAIRDSLETGGRPLWRREVLPLPDAAVHGPGPWRLRLGLASNEVWRARGWLVRDLAGHLDDPPASAFPVWLDETALHWRSPQPVEPASFRIDRSDDGGETWRPAQVVAAGEAAGQDHQVTLARLGLRERASSRVRVVAVGEASLVSRTLVAAGPDAVVLGPARPNPAAGIVNWTVDAAGDPRAEAAVYDLRGRLVRRLHLEAGPGILTWEGSDAADRRVAAGVYIVRLRAHGQTLTCKVTWLP